MNAPAPDQAVILSNCDTQTFSTPTLLAGEANQTDSTDITYSPASNAEFLSVIFAGLAEPLRPFVLGFTGKPKERKAWRGDAWRGEKTDTSDTGKNWYFTLAAYSPGEEGYNRRKKDCALIFGVMLDDVGTKALPLSRLELAPPTFVIETSPGNFQATYLFDTPVADVGRADALNQSMIEANLCDPGATGVSTRYGRMPFASNGKTDPAFVCRLVEWHPQRRYSIDEIVERLELAPPPAPKSRQTRSRPAPTDDGVFTPRPDENEVIRALKARGLYKRPLGNGRHDITCPWVIEHTDAVDYGSAYFEPSDLFPIGGFKCQHAHGEKHRIGALLEYLGVSAQAAKHRPMITVEAGELHRIVDVAESVLADTGRYYQRGGLIASVITDPATDETIIKPVSQPALLRALSSAASWQRFDARAEDYVICDPPSRHVQVLHDAEGYAHLPALAGIARQPHLRADGTLVRDAGFDVATGLFGVFDARRFTVPEHPSKADAVAALGDLSALLSEFEFADAHDEAAAVAAMMTAAVRPSLNAAPMFHVRAPQIASGKSYLSGIIAAFAGPTAPAAVAFPSTEEESQKLLLATLLSAPATLIFDNLTTDLIPHKSLCSALTEEFLTGRILGVSKTATVGTRTLFLSSGNNVGPVRDMARRCIVICLDPQVETPAARRFEHDPLATVRSSRERFVSLALLIVRAWIAAGKPATHCNPLASYGTWSEWVRQPLLWLGLPDPAQRVFEQLAADPDRETLGRLLVAWRGVFGTAPTMIRDAVSRAESGIEPASKALREALLEVAEERGEINRRRLGRWIARHQARIVDGQRFERASTTTSAERWSVQSVMSEKSVSPGKSAKSVGNEKSLDTEDAEVF